MTAWPATSDKYLSDAILRPTANHDAFGKELSDPTEAMIESFRGDLKDIEDVLLDWYSDPDALADDDVEMPTRQTIFAALRTLGDINENADRIIRENQHPFEVRGITVGTGGSIRFEFMTDSLAVALQILPGGAREQLVFAGHKLVDRTSF